MNIDDFGVNGKKLGVWGVYVQAFGVDSRRLFEIQQSSHHCMYLVRTLPYRSTTTLYLGSLMKIAIFELNVLVVFMMGSLWIEQ